ncbi:MerR family transcriptional regulator [Paenibacillus anseongensis]
MRYRLCELPELLEIPRTTIRNWLTIFHEFIPTVHQGKSVFYDQHAVSVLKRIRFLREHLYSHSTIKEILLEEGYETVVITSVI